MYTQCQTDANQLYKELNKSIIKRYNYNIKKINYQCLNVQQNSNISTNNPNPIKIPFRKFHTMFIYTIVGQ